MQEVVICDARRTPVGTFMGALKDVPATDLGAILLKDILERNSLDPSQVEEVIVGNVLQAGQGMNPARQVALKGGLPPSSTAMTVNRVCGSGLQAVISGVQEIKSGDSSLIVAGGIENMSRAPYLLLKGRTGYRLGHDSLIDSMVFDGLWDVFNDVHMAVTAENLALKFNISREEQDRFALESQMKAKEAITQGRFHREIVPVEVPQAKGEKIIFETDEHPRFDTTLEKLARLKPAFKKDGTITAGNSSGINDGAALVLLLSGQMAKELGFKARVKILGYAVGGIDPMEMGLGPVEAIKKLMKKTGLKLSHFEVVELNEAFAAQSLAVLRNLDLDPGIVNPNGGAIALGHPIGASGARLLVTLIHELERTGKTIGLVSLCIGGGQGIAMAVERV
ncbi:MAG: acetyl-CoA C-acetyltransferase [Caldiserica bacterium]|jgi:acetyl-CoA C-acetyltransferase|nr:acetyl-CoA C-acetyltransferase [Caldisericota bacterium]MDH7562764.1 acetyl-CoA C-acetyltransferase [Caldisericota bacterium]